MIWTLSGDLICQLALQVAKKVSIPFDEVDTHNVIPVWETSEKRETGARTIRSKIHKKLPEYLTVASSPSPGNLSRSSQQPDPAAQARKSNATCPALS